MDPMALISILLLCFIIYQLFSPKRPVPKEKPVAKKQQSVQIPFYPSIFVVGLTVRNDTVNVLLPCFPPTELSFPWLRSGKRSGLGYLVIKENGSISQFNTEEEAQNDFRYNKRNYGIVMLVIEPDRIITKDIHPHGHPEDYLNQITVSLGIATPGGK